VTKTADGLYEVNLRPHGSHEKLLALLGRPDRVLDVGCSTGYLAKRMQERGSSVVGLDLDERAAEQARRYCEAVHVGDVETMALPFEPASFDAIVAGDFIEHLRDPGAFLERIRPLLRPGGRLVLSTPNIANWSMRLGLLFGRFRYTEWGLLDRTHTHLFTRKTLRECLEAAGYRIAVFDFTVPVPVFSTPRAEAVAHWIGRLRPSFFAYQFVVAAEPDAAARVLRPASAEEARPPLLPQH
jgi:SAM-dependent methyltransferase